MADQDEFPSLEGVIPKTWKDYDPSKLGHVERHGSSPVREKTLLQGDMIIATESGAMDLVEVVKNDTERKKLYLAFHTSFGKPTGKPQPFVYDYDVEGVARAYVGQWMRIFEIGDIPPRYLEQALATEDFIPQEKYI